MCLFFILSLYIVLYVHIYIILSIFMSLSIFSNVYLMNLMSLLMEKGVKKKAGKGDEKSQKEGGK